MEVTREPGEKRYILGKPGRQALECPMTETELRALEREISNLSQQAFAAEEEKKRLVQPINEQLKDLKAREKELLANRERKTVLRDVPVQRVADFFKGESWVERTDVVPPEEVPETRRPLTDSERQTLLPGVVRDGDGPAADVLPLFPRRVEESTESVSEAAPAAEASSPEATETEAEPKRSPFQHPLVASPGEAVLHLDAPRGEWCVRWPVVGLDLHFAHLGMPMGFARWNKFGGEDKQGGWDRSGDTVKIPPAVLESAAAAIRSGSFSRPGLGESRPAVAPPPEKLGGADGYPLPQPQGVKASLEGWRLVVVEGKGMLRQPDGQLVGPFKWNAAKGLSDRVSYEGVPDEWWEKHKETVLPGLDALLLSGAVREAFDGYAPESPAMAASGGEQPPADDMYLSSEEAAAVAKALSPLGAELLLLLKAEGAQHSAAIGRKLNTQKPGTVINRLLKDGLLGSTSAGYVLTKKGASVAVALAASAEQKAEK